MKQKQNVFRIKSEPKTSPAKNANARNEPVQPVPEAKSNESPQPDVQPIEPSEALLKFSPDQLVQGFIFAEILGKPKSRRVR